MIKAIIINKIILDTYLDWKIYKKFMTLQKKLQ